MKWDPSRTGTILAASAATLYNMYRARKVAATRIRHILAALGIEIRPRGSLGRLAAVRARAAVGLLSVKRLRRSVGRCHAKLHGDRARLQADVERLAAELEQARRQ